jgi:hypothetical protein
LERALATSSREFIVRSAVWLAERVQMSLPCKSPRMILLGCDHFKLPPDPHARH